MMKREIRFIYFFAPEEEEWNRGRKKAKENVAKNIASIFLSHVLYSFPSN